MAQLGLNVNPKYPHWGWSPDDIDDFVTWPTGESGLLEIKCPDSDRWQMKSPAEYGLDSDFYCTLDENQNLKLIQISYMCIFIKCKAKWQFVINNGLIL